MSDGSARAATQFAVPILLLGLIFYHPLLVTHSLGMDGKDGAHYTGVGGRREAQWSAAERIGAVYFRYLLLLTQRYTEQLSREVGGFEKGVKKVQF